MEINELSHNPYLMSKQMTLRAYYAGLNMQAHYTTWDDTEYWPTESWRMIAAQEAIKGADELIKQLTNS